MPAALSETITCDLCVIGAGSAGLSTAAGAAQMGADTVLIEKHKMGGDCLNYGCVPSKALIAAAKAAHQGGKAGRFGVTYGPPEVDFRAVHDHIRGVIAGIEPHDSVERFEGLGIRVIQAHGRFTGPGELEAGGTRIRAKRFLVATGSRPFVPPVPGLESVPYLTNETVFDLTELPRHLIVVGGGPIGCELGQAFRRLGAKVSLVEMFSIMPKDDPDLVDILRGRLRDEGLDIHEQSRVASVEATADGIAVIIEKQEGQERIEGSHLLLAAGRRPNVEELGLEAAGVAYERAGISVNRRLRSSNRRIYAAGDVAGGLQFTHVAGYHAGIVIRNLLFRLPAKTKDTAIPWVTYSDPELAHVGWGEAEARKRQGNIKVVTWPLAENDRARTERDTEGLIKVVTAKNGKILGASILGSHAGELIAPWILAIDRGLKIGAMAGAVMPYPTRSELGKRAAGSYYTESLFSARTRKIVRFLLRFP